MRIYNKNAGAGNETRTRDLNLGKIAPGHAQDADSEREASFHVGLQNAQPGRVPATTCNARIPALLWLGLILMVLALLAGGWALTPKEPPSSPPCFDDRANPVCDRLGLAR